MRWFPVNLEGLTLGRSKPCAEWDFQNPLFGRQFRERRAYEITVKWEGMTRVGHY